MAKPIDEGKAIKPQTAASDSKTKAVDKQTYRGPSFVFQNT